jgi:hypothetical protein
MRASSYPFIALQSSRRGETLGWLANREGLKMNKMVIGGVNNQIFVASTLGRIEQFYSMLGLPLVKRTVHHLDPRLPVTTFGFQAFEGEPKRRHTISYVEWNPMIARKKS